MNGELNKEPQEIEINVKKVAYKTPNLIKYGEVRSITQSGSQGPNENAAMMDDDPSAFMTQSDRSLKEDIVRIGDHPRGFGLYLFSFKPEFCAECGYGRQFGVMADEVEQVIPVAVSTNPKGHKMVNYAMLGILRSDN